MGKGKSLIQDNIQKAFDAYCACGGSITAVEQSLARQGLKLSRQTLYEWEKKFNWQNRKAVIDQKRQDREGESHEDRMLQGLLDRKKKYEQNFSTEGEIDNQATYAYTTLVKNIIDIKGRSNAARAENTIQFLRDMVEFLHKNDPAGAVLMENNLDEFVQYIREKYGN